VTFTRGFSVWVEVMVLAWEDEWFILQVLLVMATTKLHDSRLVQHNNIHNTRPRGVGSKEQDRTQHTGPMGVGSKQQDRTQHRVQGCRQQTARQDTTHGSGV
jgi:hypothetical protein